MKVITMSVINYINSLEKYIDKRLELEESKKLYIPREVRDKVKELELLKQELETNLQKVLNNAR